MNANSNPPFTKSLDPPLGLRPPSHPRGPAPQREWMNRIIMTKCSGSRPPSTAHSNTIHPGIQASTLLGQTPEQGVFCTLCREPDHKSMGCALSYLQEPQSPAWPIVPTPAGMAASLKGCQSLKRRQTPEQRVCRSWNRGEYMFRNCNYFVQAAQEPQSRNLAQQPRQ